MRLRIAQIIQPAENGDRLSRGYDMVVMFVALISLVPLMFKENNAFLDMVDHVTVYILFFDYIMRWMVYDKLSRLKRPWAFILYPVTPLAIIDLVSLLPSLGLLGQGFRVLRMLRLFKLLHYSKSFMKIVKAFQKEKRTLGTVLLIAVVYIFISALVMFAYEPETFDSFFDALYWATTALTTVGYGDIAPSSDVGRLISMISSLFGIAVIALPAGIITTSFVEELSNRNEENSKEKNFLIRLKEKMAHMILQDPNGDDSADKEKQEQEAGHEK